MDDNEILKFYQDGGGGGADGSHVHESSQLPPVDKIDHFGTIHENGIPKELVKKYDKQRKLDMKREKKWRNMLPNLQGNRFKFEGGPIMTRRLPEKVIRRCYKGIPHTLRSVIWPALLDIYTVKETHPGIYEKMLIAGKRFSTFIRQIHVDVQRTFRRTTFYYENYGGRMRSLFNVLLAYSVYNAEIGYCQGMNEIAGLFLMYMADEEDAFWALSQFMCCPKWAMHGCFVNSLVKNFRFFRHLERIIERFIPKLLQHFRKHDIQTDVYAIKWFMMCFIDRVPLSLCYRLWDIYLLEGEVLLHSMSYNILKLHKRPLLKMDECDVYSYLQTTLASNFGYTDEDTIDSLKSCIEDLRKANLAHLSEPPLDSIERPLQPFGEYVRKKELELLAAKKKAKSINATVATNTTATTNTSTAKATGAATTQRMSSSITALKNPQNLSTTTTSATVGKSNSVKRNSSLQREVTIVNSNEVQLITMKPRRPSGKVKNITIKEKSSDLSSIHSKRLWKQIIKTKKKRRTRKKRPQNVQQHPNLSHEMTFYRASMSDDSNSNSIIQQQQLLHSQQSVTLVPRGEWRVGGPLRRPIKLGLNLQEVDPPSSRVYGLHHQQQQQQQQQLHRNRSSNGGGPSGVIIGGGIRPQSSSYASDIRQNSIYDPINPTAHVSNRVETMI